MSELTNDNIEIIQDFIQESRDALEQLEQSIIELGRSEGDPQAINVIFRLFHSMKGTASFLGLRHIANVTHAAESLLDQIRSGQIKLEIPGHVDLFIQASDFAKEALVYVENHLNDSGMEDGAKTLTARLHGAISGRSAAKPQVPVLELSAAPVKPSQAPVAAPPVMEAPKAPAPPPAKKETEFFITPEMVERFIQESDELLQKLEHNLLEWIKSPDSKEVVSESFRNIHSFKGNCGFFGYADMERLSHQMENLLDIARSGASMDVSHAADTMLQLKDTLRNAIADASQGGSGAIIGLEALVSLLEEEAKAAAPPGGEEREVNRIGEILVAEGVVSAEDVVKALDVQSKPLGEILVDLGVANHDAVERALNKQSQKEEGAKPKTAAIKRQDIRVDLEKLDTLITLIGELVIAENMLVNNPDLSGLELENFNKAAQQTSKIVRELQELAMVIRMVPVSGLFRRMIRLVHDLAVKCNKKVELRLAGEETEVDKTIIEIITDPLVHMIRNAADHGVETPEERKNAGKPETGTVNLSASHEEGEVWITIEDDGKGLDRDRIIAKARQVGALEGDGSDLSDKAVFGFIFLPGFSTADKISDVSGRGVGMDVVKQNLDKINCKIEVSSTKGQGTRFVLRIPLTLAIIDGMLIRVGRSKYILPIISIRESFSPNPGVITISTDGQELARVREEFIPVVRLHELHRLSPDSKELSDGILIVLDTADGNIALFVDEILGQQQTVIKGLSKYIMDVGKVRGVSGCTILGNGDVCLILDVRGLVEATARHG
ncbi:MAG: chemotaxis protein CheA [Nitrospinae bacterium]|nr:chemotaxis protein CheA [Nitrospinota bacterium]